MATNTDRNWNKGMTTAEMLPLMSNAEINKNARKGGVAAISEQRRRRAPPAPAKAADIRGAWHRYSDRIAPDPELDIGV